MLDVSLRTQASSGVGEGPRGSFVPPMARTAPSLDHETASTASSQQRRQYADDNTSQGTSDRPDHKEKTNPEAGLLSDMFKQAMSQKSSSSTPHSAMSEDVKAHLKNWGCAVNRTLGEDNAEIRQDLDNSNRQRLELDNSARRVAPFIKGVHTSPPIHPQTRDLLPEEVPQLKHPLERDLSAARSVLRNVSRGRSPVPVAAVSLPLEGTRSPTSGSALVPPPVSPPHSFGQDGRFSPTASLGKPMTRTAPRGVSSADPVEDEASMTWPGFRQLQRTGSNTASNVVPRLPGAADRQGAGPGASLVNREVARLGSPPPSSTHRPASPRQNRPSLSHAPQVIERGMASPSQQHLIAQRPVSQGVPAARPPLRHPSQPAPPQAVQRPSLPQPQSVRTRQEAGWR
jgi:hypothetical protein